MPTAKQAGVEADATASRPHARPPQSQPPPPKPTSDQGLGAVDAPIDWQVLRGPVHRQLGQSSAAGPGTYDLQMRRPISTSKRVEVAAGRVARVEVNLPDGTINLNAAPWAEVYLDGRSLGETPIANASVSVGTHEVIFRNPQFNELRQMVTVASGKATRLAVTLTKK